MSLKCNNDIFSINKSNVVDHDMFFNKSIQSSLQSHVSTSSQSSTVGGDDGDDGANECDDSIPDLVSKLSDSINVNSRPSTKSTKKKKSADSTVYLIPVVHNEDGSIKLPDAELAGEVEKLKETFFEDVHKFDNKKKLTKSENVKIRYGANSGKWNAMKLLSFSRYNGDGTDLTNFSLGTRQHFDEEEMLKKKVEDVKTHRNLWEFTCNICHTNTALQYPENCENRQKAAICLLRYIYYDLFISHQMLCGPLSLFSLVVYEELRNKYKDSSILLSLSNNQVIRMKNLISLINIVEDHLDISNHLLLRLSCCKACICVYCLHHYIYSQVKKQLSDIQCPYGSNDSLFDSSTIALGCPPSVHRTIQLLKKGTLKEPVTLKCKKCKRKYRCATMNELFAAKCETCNEELRTNDEKFKIWIHGISSKKKNAIRCPKCKVYIQKISGCDHMDCSLCGCWFCYKCGKKHNNPLVPRFYDHGGVLDPVSFFGCSYFQSKRRTAAHMMVCTSFLIFGTAMAPVAISVSIPVLMGIGVVVLSLKLKRNFRKKLKTNEAATELQTS